MKIAVIKKINEQMPYCLKAPFSKIIRNRLIKNNIFFKQYEELVQFSHMTELEKSKLQLEKLKIIMINAYVQTPYYHDLFDRVKFDPYKFQSFDDIKSIPTLEKDIIQKHLGEMSSDSVTKYYQVTTGGTTGKPIHVLMESDAIYREWAFVYHYWSKFGYDYRSSRLATFRGVEFKGKLSIINPLYNEIRMNPFLMNRNNICSYIERIEKYQADYIYGYPSAIYNFCRLSKENGIKLDNKFKAAFLISENLYDFQEKLIQEVLKCPIAMFYGHSERAVFGEKYDSGYVFNPLYGYFEVNSEGNPIVTGFINHKTPLIRYTVDDFVEQKSDGTYLIIGHHDSNVLYGSNGEQISIAAINFHDNTFNDVEAYQFVQDSIGKCILKIVTTKDVNLNAIKSSVERKLGISVKCDVEQVSEVTMTKRGKYQMLIQNCNRKE